MKTGLILPVLLTVTALASGEGLGVAPLTPLSSHFITIDGTRIHYRETQSNQSPSWTLLLIHGWLGSSFDFVPLMERLPPTMRVVAVDLPGSGLSDKKGISFSLDYFLGFLEQFSHRLGLNHLILVGHSMGGELAIRYTVLHPEQVRRLILIDPFGLAGESRFIRFIGKFGLLIDLGFALNNRLAVDLVTRFNVFYNPSLVTGEYIDSLAETNLTASGRRAQEEITKRVLGSRPIDGMLSLVGAPTLIFWGREDHVLSRKWAPRFLEGIPDSRLVIVPRTGHMPQFEAPAVVAKDITGFLEGNNIGSH